MSDLPEWTALARADPAHALAPDASDAERLAAWAGFDRYLGWSLCEGWSASRHGGHPGLDPVAALRFYRLGLAVAEDGTALILVDARHDLFGHLLARTRPSTPMAGRRIFDRRARFLPATVLSAAADRGADATGEFIEDVT